MTRDLFSLPGRVALITGGNGGLGRAIARGLQEAGARVAVTGRDPAKNAIIGHDLGDPDAMFALDVRDEEAVAVTVARVVERCGGLDILVNNAGVAHDESVLTLARTDWDTVVETSLTSMFLCAKHAAAAIVAQASGRV